MNKWMVRFWGLLALVSLAMLVKITAWAAEPARFPVIGVMSAETSNGAMVTNRPVTPNPQLALGSMLGFLRVSSEAIGNQVLAYYHDQLRRAVEEEPEAQRVADVLLRRGFNASEVEQLLSRHGLDYLSCEVKTPVSDGTAMTMWNFVGGPMMLPLEGVPIAERVERDIGRWRHRFMHDSKLGGPPETADKRREIASSREIGVYRVEVLGTRRSLLDLLQEPEVRGVVAETDGERARTYEAIKARAPRHMPVYRSRTPPLLR